MNIYVSPLWFLQNCNLRTTADKTMKDKKTALFKLKKNIFHIIDHIIGTFVNWTCPTLIFTTPAPESKKSANFQDSKISSGSVFFARRRSTRTFTNLFSSCRSSFFLIFYRRNFEVFLIIIILKSTGLSFKCLNDPPC